MFQKLYIYIYKYSNYVIHATILNPASGSTISIVLERTQFSFDTRDEFGKLAAADHLKLFQDNFPW